MERSEKHQIQNGSYSGEEGKRMGLEKVALETVMIPIV